LIFEFIFAICALKNHLKLIVLAAYMLGVDGRLFVRPFSLHVWKKLLPFAFFHYPTRIKESVEVFKAKRYIVNTNISIAVHHQNYALIA